MTPQPGDPMPITLEHPTQSGSVIVDDLARTSVFEVNDLAVRYSGSVAVEGVDLEILEHQITAMIGPSGCGKSTVLRCFNRMNDLIPGATVSGSVRYHGEDLYARSVDPVEVRRQIGMVFQRPNPFPKSIFDNVAFGPKVNGVRKGIAEVVERALTQAALWDEVKDQLKKSAYALPYAPLATA